MSRLAELIKKNRIKTATISEGMILKELEVGKKDLATAEASLGSGNFKWATIQAYYGIFHGARALLFAAGYREESHLALRQAVYELYVETGRLGNDAYRALERGLELRELADYKETFSEDSSRLLCKNVGVGLAEIEKLLSEVLKKT
jgi:uncharacterized protein (UPF0332 family)